jgi:hypothetical protein
MRFGVSQLRKPAGDVLALAVKRGVESDLIVADGFGDGLVAR